MPRSTLLSVAVLGVIAGVLAGCAQYKQTLTDGEGRTVTCEASGKAGLLTGALLRSGFEECIADAKARGYAAEQASPARAPSSQPPPAPQSARVGGASNSDVGLQTKVQTLKAARAQGLISEAEYEAKLRALMESL